MNAFSDRFIGQDEAWAEFASALASERMHHAWLLAGARGLGKRAFARYAAVEIVGREGRPAPASDPDILLLDHLPKDDSEAKKKADGKAFETKRNLTVDQIRAMQRRLTTRPTLGDRRVIIVDPADDMEKGAVNALLKSLEEPPANTYFLLIAHQPGKLLPTIRSRCRILRFAPLSDADVDAVLRRELTEASDEDRASAIAAAHGSPGVAISVLVHGLGNLHDVMMRVLHEGDPGFELRGALAQEMGARPSRAKQFAALDLARATLAALLPGAARSTQLRIIEAHAQLTRLSAQAPTFNFDPGLLIMEIGGLLASAAVPREPAQQN